MPKPDYIDVDRLQGETTLEEAAARCGVQIEPRGPRKEVRIDCPFQCSGDHVGRKEISINVDHPQKVFYCHAYQCHLRGNLLTLMHGWTTGRLPQGGKLKGAEFNAVKTLLAGGAAAPPQTQTQSSSKASEVIDPIPERNVPLADSDNEAARGLVDIDAKFRIDPAEMNPNAARYVRQRPFLSSELMKKWRMGYLPNDGGGDKRGWSLRGHIVYAFLSEDNKLLGWFGRDPVFEEKDREFLAIPLERRGDKKPPVKHKFPAGFHRGLELFGQHSARLREEGYREKIARYGIVVVEGANDVIRLDTMGIPAVGLCSNRITVEQARKIARWAKQLSDGRVTVMLDCDVEGEEGAKQAVWELSQQAGVTLAWSRSMQGGKYVDRQPESLTEEEWREVAGGILWSHDGT